jgi:Cu2+-exporting ATPase
MTPDDTHIGPKSTTCACCRICDLEPGSPFAESGSDRGGPGHVDFEHEPPADNEGAAHDRVGGGHHDHRGHEQMFRRRFWFSPALSVPVLLWSPAIQNWFGYTAPEFPGSDLIVPVLASVVFFYGGLPFLRMAGWELRDRRPGMMTLISLAITVAYVFSMATLAWDLGEDFFWELVTLIDVMLFGHWMEMRSVRQASGALDALAALMPDVAEVVLDDGTVESRAVDRLALGDTILIRPGASVPADGIVTVGSSEVTEAMITGESRPVAKKPGAQVIAGTVNDGSGSLRAQVSATGDDTALAGIMKLVAEAEASKSPTQLLADRAASFLFYAALAAAAVTAVAWTVHFGGPEQETLARVVTVLVIACPHALGLAIPLVVANTTQIAAQHGTLIREREAIDTAKDLEIIAVDKTGTLTEGAIGVVDVATVGGVDGDEALAIAAAVEGDSEHLVARAIREAARRRDLTLPDVGEFESLKGRGVKASLDGDVVSVGGPRLLEALDLELPRELAEFAAEAGRRGQSVVYVCDRRGAVAAITLADLIRPESYTAVRALEDRNVEVAMLTGDSREVAATVAGELGIDRYFAEVLPADKDQYVGELQTQGRMVGMVGDGVNDAPALTRADIGIAIGSGTDVAVQSAGLILVKSNPLDIVRILMLSAASYRKQIQNIWWAAGYNIIMIPLAAGILAPLGFLMPPAIGALFMSISTIVVAVNAQLLRRIDLNVR